MGDLDGDGFADVATGALGANDDTDRVVVLRGASTGLHPAAAQLLDSSMAPATPDSCAEASFGGALVTGDTDADGRDELIVRIRCFAGEGSELAVFAGSPTGPETTGTRWAASTAGMPAVVAAAGQLGAALAAADFDGDGFADLAVGNREVNAFAGQVLVLPGSADGLTTTGSRAWHQGSPGVPGSDQGWDQFGQSLGAADFNGDGYADLAIGVPGEDGPNPFGRGAVVVLHGSANGLTSAGVQRWTQASAGVPDRPENGDVFGHALVAGQFGRSGRADLAIGVPRESFGGTNHAGIVEILYGTSSGLSAANARAFSRASRGIGGAPSHEYFGYVLGGYVVPN